MPSETMYKRPTGEYVVRVNRTLQGNDLNIARYNSYEQLIITEKLRRLTKGELRRKQELSQQLIKAGLIRAPKSN